MKKGMISTMFSQFRTVPPVETADLTGQTVIVVGANTGIGFEATKHFARMNPGKLILACRSQAKGDAALAKLKAETNCTTAELWLIDLANFASVTAFADKFERSGLRLDILVANAGIALFDYKTTKDGWEETIQVNNLSTSLLCILLAPRLVETAQKYGTKPRMVVVASSVHYWLDLPEKAYEAESSFQYLSSKEYCTPEIMEHRYTQSKLLNVFFVRAFASLLSSKSSPPFIINTLCPGYCYSELRRTFTGIRGFIDWLMERVFAWTSEQGGRQLVFAAVGERTNPEKLHGEFLDLTKPTEPNDCVLGEEGKKKADKLWADLIRELAKVDSRVPEIVKQLSK